MNKPTLKDLDQQLQAAIVQGNEREFRRLADEFQRRGLTELAATCRRGVTTVRSLLNSIRPTGGQ